MARSLIVTQYMSLDGVIEDPVGMEGSGLGDWTGPFSRGLEGDRIKLDELAAATAMIYGRVTYQAFAAAWPHIADDTGYAARMNALPKYLASSSLAEASWGDTTIWNGDLAAQATALKASGEGDVLIFGSASIVHQLAGAGLIDEYRLMVYPTVLGRGKRLFPADVQTSLALIESRRLGGGIVLLHYRRF